MSHLRYRDRFQHLSTIREEMLEAADPAQAITANFSVHDDQIKIQGRSVTLNPRGRIFLLAFGKASLPMMLQTLAILNDDPISGLASIPEAAEPPPHPQIQWIRGGHPLPTEGSLRAGELAARMLSNLTTSDQVIVLISGGGSAMFELLRPGIDLADLQQLNRTLLRSGAPIEKVNTVRKSISRLKAGGLARMAAPAPVLSLIFSDVIGDPMSAIASGPTVLRRVSNASARGVLDEYDLWDRIPSSVAAALRGADAPSRQAPGPINIVLANNRLLVEAAARTAAQLGFKVKIRSRQLHGEANAVGRRIGRSLSIVKDLPTCLLYGGETTVRVRGPGKGGRNQELALSAALSMQETRHRALLSFASDGIDGPTDAAGAIVDSETIAEAHSRRLDPAAALANNDSYPLLKAVERLVYTGPTGTNLNDIVVALAYAE